MAERFTLRDLPKYEAIEALAAEHTTLEPAAATAWLEVLRTGSDLLGVYDAMVRSYGLSQGRFTTLMLLHCPSSCGGPGVEGWSRPSDLADKGGLSRAAMTSILESLAGDGWLEREPDPADRRSTLVRLSSSGAARIAAILPEHFTAISALMDGLNANDLRTLAELLSALRQGIAQSPLNTNEHTQTDGRPGGALGASTAAEG